MGREQFLNEESDFFRIIDCMFDFPIFFSISSILQIQSCLLEYNADISEMQLMDNREKWRSFIIELSLSKMIMTAIEIAGGENFCLIFG